MCGCGSKKVAALGADPAHAAADHLGEADHEQCEIKILMAGGLLPLTRDAAGRHPEADQVYLVHGERHVKAFPKGCVLLAA